MDARALFALFAVFIVMPIVTVWVAYQIYKLERPKTSAERWRDLGRFVLLFLVWSVVTLALEAALQAILRVQLASAGRLPGALLLAALSLLYFDPRMRKKSILVISGLLAAIVIHAALNLVR
jgi:uncharacterized membrane protein